MSFLKELFVRFLGLFKDDRSHVVETHTVSVTPPITSYNPLHDKRSELKERAYRLADAVGVPRAAIERVMGNRAEVLFGVIDMGRRASEKRFFLFNLRENKVEKMYVAHGKNSDKGPGNTGWATKFSNVKNSHKTSLGLYRCAEEYKSAKFGRAMRLDGLDLLLNSNARDRGIVLHGSSYVEEKYVKKNGVTGRSLGCPAVGYQYRDKVINALGGGGMLFIYKEGENI